MIVKILLFFLILFLLYGIMFICMPVQLPTGERLAQPWGQRTWAELFGPTGWCNADATPDYQ